MSLIFHPASVLCFIVLSSCALPICCWLTWKTIINGYETLYPSNLLFTKSNSSSSIPHHQQTGSSRSLNGNGKSNPAKWTMLWTILSSCLFTLAVLVNLVRRCIYYHRISDNESYDEDNGRKIRRNSQVLIAFQVISFSSSFFAVACLLIACFERLVLTFKNSQYRLSDRTVWIGRGSTIVGLVSSFTAFGVSLATRAVQWSVIAVVPAFCFYPVFSFYMIYRFMHTTQIIAEKMMGMRMSIANMEAVDESAMQRTTQLLDASLRLSVVATVSVLSTFLVMLFGVIGLGVGYDPFALIAYLALPLDSVWNNFALLSTFQKSMPYYRFVFGRLHGWLLRKLTVRLRKIRSISHT